MQFYHEYDEVLQTVGVSTCDPFRLAFAKVMSESARNEETGNWRLRLLAEFGLFSISMDEGQTGRGWKISMIKPPSQLVLETRQSKGISIDEAVKAIETGCLISICLRSTSVDFINPTRIVLVSIWKK